MFTERELKLLAILLSIEEWMPGKVLANMLNVGSRTLQNEIAAVNAMLQADGASFGIVSNNRLGYRLEGNREQIRRLVGEMGIAGTSDPFENANSILTVLLFEEDYITLNRIADQTFLAPSSVSANLGKVRKMIDRAKGACLSVHPRRGYRLDAAEHVRRMLMVNALGKTVPAGARQYAEAEEGYAILESVRRILKDVLLEDNCIIEGAAFDAFSSYCAFSIIRTRNGHIVAEEIALHEIHPIVRKISRRFEQELDVRFTEKELLCMDDRLEDLNVLGISKKDYPEVEARVREFSRQVSEETGLAADLDASFIKRMSEHCYRMERRLDVGNYLGTPDPEAIEKQYPAALHLVRTVLRKVFGRKLPGNEERLIVPYIASFINDAGMAVDIDIISDLPVGEVYRFRSRLYETYGSAIRAIRIFPAYLYEERFARQENDALLFTTEETLVFRHHSLTYIDLYEDTYESVMIGRMIKDRSDAMKRDCFSSYAKKYAGEVCECEEHHDLQVILKNHIRQELLECGSMSVIDGTDLLVITHGGETHMQKRILLKQGTEYEGRKINRILYFNIGCRNDANLFCQYIRESINKRI